MVFVSPAMTKGHMLFCAAGRESLKPGKYGLHGEIVDPIPKLSNQPLAAWRCGGLLSIDLCFMSQRDLILDSPWPICAYELPCCPPFAGTYWL